MSDESLLLTGALAGVMVEGPHGWESLQVVIPIKACKQNTPVR